MSANENLGVYKKRKEREKKSRKCIQNRSIIKKHLRKRVNCKTDEKGTEQYIYI